MNKKAIILLIFLITPALIFSYDFVSSEFDTDLTITSYLQNVDKSYPPMFMNDWLIFSDTTKENPRYKGVSFEHENYRKIHLFKKNQNDTYIFAYKLPSNIDRIKYRFIEDGLWMTDKSNDSIEVDNRGFKISTLNIPQAKIKYTKSSNPIINDNSVTFKINDEPNRQIFLTGSFISWDPFAYPLTETSPGNYEISIKLNNGKHRYYFVKDGNKILDNRNSEKDNSLLEGPVSCFSF